MGVIMEHTIEFKNFKKTNTTISADLYLENEFVVTLTDNIAHMFNTQNTKIGLYNYFKSAVLTYISYNKGFCYNQSATNSTNH